MDDLLAARMQAIANDDYDLGEMNFFETAYEISQSIVTDQNEDQKLPEEPL